MSSHFVAYSMCREEPAPGSWILRTPDRGRCRDLAHTWADSRPATCSRSSTLLIFPPALFGRSSKNSTRSGSLYLAMPWLRQGRTAVREHPPGGENSPGHGQYRSAAS